jgi:hypothetical protein
LGLEEYGILYVPDGRMEYHGIIVKHGDYVRKYAGWSAKAEMESEGMSGVSGHTHRIGIYERNTAGGRSKWVEEGCLCSFKQPYLRGRTPDWHHGFAIGYMKKGSKRFDIHPIEIVNGKAMYDGREFY